MLPYRDSRLTRIALAIFFCIIVGYAYYEARGLLYGPVIDLPEQTMTATDSPYIMIQGRADRIASLSVDGQQIQVTETGAFQDPYVLAPGVNRIVLDAKDKYGNVNQKVIEIVYTPSATSSMASDVTTATATSSQSDGFGSSTSLTSPMAPAR